MPGLLLPLSSSQAPYAKENYTHAHGHLCVQRSSATRQGSRPSPHGQEGGFWAVSCGGEGKHEEREQKQQGIDRLGLQAAGLSGSAWQARSFLRADGNSSFGSGTVHKGHFNPFCWPMGSWLVPLSAGGWLSSARARGWSAGCLEQGGSKPRAEQIPAFARARGWRGALGFLPKVVWRKLGRH